MVNPPSQRKACRRGAGRRERGLAFLSCPLLLLLLLQWDHIVYWGLRQPPRHGRVFKGTSDVQSEESEADQGTLHVQADLVRVVVVVVVGVVDTSNVRVIAFLIEPFARCTVFAAVSYGCRLENEVISLWEELKAFKRKVRTAQSTHLIRNTSTNTAQNLGAERTKALRI